MQQRSHIFDAADVRIGAYKVDAPVLDRLASFAPLANLSDPPSGFRTEGGGFFRGQDPNQPIIGDVRVTFGGVAAQTVAVAAASVSGVLTTYHDGNGYAIALAQPGSGSAADMFAAQKKVEGTLTWILRGVGFVLVFIGFICIARPLTMLFAVLPFLESIVGAGVFLAAMTLSVPVTLVTIAVAWIVHRPLVGILLLVAAGGGMFLLGKIGPRRRPAGFTPGRV